MDVQAQIKQQNVGMRCHTADEVSLRSRHGAGRVSTAAVSARSQGSAEESDSDRQSDASDEEDIGWYLRPRWRLYDVACKVITGLRLRPTVDGVSIKDVAERNRRRYELKFFPLELEEREWLEDIFRAHSLMFKSTDALRTVCQALRLDRGVKNSNQTALDVRLRGFGKACQAAHKLKFYTARHCWTESVLPLKTQLKRLEGQYEALKRQFNTVRSEYLQELAVLRDEARGRKDPEEGVEGSSGKDIRTFFEPVATLNEEELSFVSAVIQEKLKMIFDVNPDCQANLSQVSAMIEKDEDNQVNRLKKTIQNQEQEIRDLKTQMRQLQASNLEAAGAPPPPQAGSGQGAGAKVVDMFERQIEELRDTVKTQQRELVTTRELKVRCDELQASCECELANKQDLNAKLDKVNSDNARLTENLKREDDRRQNAEKKLSKVMQEYRILQEQMKRLQSRLNKAPAADKRPSQSSSSPVAVSRGSKNLFDTSVIPLAPPPSSSFGPMDRLLGEGELERIASVGHEADSSASDSDSLGSGASSDIGDLPLVAKKRSSAGGFAGSQYSAINNESLRRVEARRIADEALSEAKKMKNLQKQFCGTDADDGGEEDEVDDILDGLTTPSTEKGYRQQMERLHAEGERVATLLEAALNNATASHVEAIKDTPCPEELSRSAASISELRQKARKLSFQTFCTAILLEAARLGVKPGSDILRSIKVHCDHLCAKLEDGNQAFVSLMTEMLSLHSQALDTVKEMQNSTGTMSEEVKAGLGKLERLAGKAEKLQPVLSKTAQSAVDRLTTVKKTSDRAMQRKKEAEMSARRASYSGMVMLAEDEAEEESTGPSVAHTLSDPPMSPMSSRQTEKPVGLRRNLYATAGSKQPESADPLAALPKSSAVKGKWHAAVKTACPAADVRDLMSPSPAPFGGRRQVSTEGAEFPAIKGAAGGHLPSADPVRKKAQTTDLGGLLTPVSPAHARASPVPMPQMTRPEAEEKVFLKALPGKGPSRTLDRKQGKKPDHS